jgi:hypothetical protein
VRPPREGRLGPADLSRASATGEGERRIPHPARGGHQLPSDVETAECTAEAEKLANDIRARAEYLATITATAHAALNEAARLALAVAEESRRLWEDNTALDKLTAAADVARPGTQRADGPTFPIATPLALLLRDHFIDARPAAVDAALRREICDALV